MNNYSKLILGEEDSQTAPVCNVQVREMLVEIEMLRAENSELKYSWLLIRQRELRGIGMGIEGARIVAKTELSTVLNAARST